MADSSLKVPVASKAPAAVHRLPVWTPVLAADLKNRTPVIHPPVSVVNRVPSSTELGSCESAVTGVCVELNRVQGHAPTPAVVNVHEYGAVMALPAMSRAPLTVAV